MGCTYFRNINYMFLKKELSLVGKGGKQVTKVLRRHMKILEREKQGELKTRGHFDICSISI